MTNLEEYGTAVLDGKIEACEKIKRQYEKLLEDLYHPREWHFDEDLAIRPVEFIEQFCRQAQGKIGEPLILDLFQKAMLEAVFGFVDDNDLRRYQEVLNIIGRKNGKTTLLAAIGIYMLLADGEGAPECYNIATAREQAMKGFNEFWNMVRQSPILSKRIRKRQNDLYCKENLGFFKALATNVNSLDGLNGHCIVIDELAAIKNRDVYDLMKQSQGSRDQPLLCCITTNGFVRGGIFDSQYEYAEGVLNGSIQDTRFLPIIYELDKPAEWTDPKKWIKANPGLGSIKKLSFLSGCVNKAKGDAAFKPTVIVKDFNLKENTAGAWLTWEELNNEETFELSKMGFRYGIGCFDAADSVDLNAAKVLCMRPEDDRIYVHQMYWIPQKKLDERKDRHHPDDAPYDLWVSQGLLRVVPGNKVNKQVFLDWFLEVQSELDIYFLYFGYDRWHIDDSLELRFQQEFGKNAMIPVIQGTKTLSRPMKDLKAEFQAHRIVYNNNPIDKYCLLNTYAKTDINGNIQPDKGLSATHRIDGAAALLDGFVVLQNKMEEYKSLI